MSLPLTNTPFTKPIALLAAIAVAGLSADATAKKRRKAGPIPALNTDGSPNIQAAAAVVIEPRTGIEFVSVNPDEVRYIASTGKIFVAMLVRRLGIDLEGKTMITRVDRDYARGGARTRLSVNYSFKNIDLLRAMLVASDNRAPTALGRAVNLDPNELVAKLNSLAEELGLEHTSFTDPSGLRGNQSTARELALALAAALEDPVLAEIMRTQQVAVHATHRKARAIHYRNTNRALLANRYPVTGGKTGFTNAAGYCLLIGARLSGRDVVMVFLGTTGKLTRFADFHRVAAWFTNGGTKRGRSAMVGASMVGRGTLERILSPPP